MSEFKITGAKYVSQWNGSSLNAGTDVSPYAHPADSANSSQALILGTGVYKGGWSGSRNPIGDGSVIIDGLNGTNIGVQGDITNGPTRNIWFKNVANQMLSFSQIMADCILENCPNGLWGSTSVNSPYRIIFLTDSVKRGDSNRWLQNCIILGNLNSTDTFSILQYCYLDKAKRFTTAASINNANFKGNCLNGFVNVSGVDYELKKFIDGTTRSDASGLIPDVIDVYPNVYVNGNFATLDAKFIDVLNRIVSPDSDLLKKSGTLGAIGGVKPGKSISVNSIDSNISITTTDINTTDPANYLIQAPATEGFINIIWKLSDNISEIQKLYLASLLDFDGSAAGGSVGNNNVPDTFPTSYTPLTQAGLKPNRLLYGLRTSQSIAKPTLDSEWDNDSAALGTTPGTYYRQEWDTKPSIVAVLGVRYGNGNPESIGGVANGINARWAQAQIRLTNNRFF
jgi:hypothetical protein